MKPTILYWRRFRRRWEGVCNLLPLTAATIGIIRIMESPSYFDFGLGVFCIVGLCHMAFLDIKWQIACKELLDSMKRCRAERSYPNLENN